MAIKKTFPKDLMVTIEDDGEAGYFNAEPVSDMEESARSHEWSSGKKVAVYRLVETKTLKVTVELVK